MSSGDARAFGQTQFSTALAEHQAPKLPHRRKHTRFLDALGKLLGQKLPHGGLPATESALLVIDVQEMYDAAANSRPIGEDATAPHNFKARLAHAVHAARLLGMRVIFVMHDIRKGAVKNRTLEWAKWAQVQGFGKNRCLPLDFCRPSQEEVVILKRTFDAFLHTGLKPMLAELGVKRLLVCGLLTGVCVTSTVLSARAAGYPVTVLSDATTDNADRHRQMLQLLGTVADVQEVAEAFAPDKYRPDPLLAVRLLAAHLQDPQQPRHSVDAQPEVSWEERSNWALLLLDPGVGGLPPAVAELAAQTREHGGLVCAIATRETGRGLPPSVASIATGFACRCGSLFGARDAEGRTLRKWLSAYAVGNLVVAGGTPALGLFLVMDSFNRRFDVFTVAVPKQAGEGDGAALDWAKTCDGYISSDLPVAEIVDKMRTSPCSPPPSPLERNRRQWQQRIAEEATRRDVASTAAGLTPASHS